MTLKAKAASTIKVHWPNKVADRGWLRLWYVYKYTW